LFCDVEGIKQGDSPLIDFSDKWRREFDCYQSRHFAFAYMKELGAELIEEDDHGAKSASKRARNVGSKVILG